MSRVALVRSDSAAARTLAWEEVGACKPRGGRVEDLDHALAVARALDEGAMCAVNWLHRGGFLQPWSENTDIVRRHAHRVAEPTYAVVRDYLHNEEGYHYLVACGIALQFNTWRGWERS